MSSTDAARGESRTSRVDWPALSSQRPAAAPAGEVVYLWNAGAEAEHEAEPATDYLGALVALVDDLTQRLVASERERARAEAERDSARALAQISRNEAGETARQLLAYCRSLVELNCALDESRSENSSLTFQLNAMRTALHHMAHSPLALPVRARLLALAEVPLGTGG